MGPRRKGWEIPHQKSGRHNNLSPQGFALCCLLDYLSSLTWKKDRCRSFSQMKWEIIHIASTTNPNTLGWVYILQLITDGKNNITRRMRGKESTYWCLLFQKRIHGMEYNDYKIDRTLVSAVWCLQCRSGCDIRFWPADSKPDYSHQTFLTIFALI